MALAGSALLLIIVLIVAYVSLNTVKYDKEAAKSEATQIIDVLNTRNYEDLFNTLPMNMRYKKTPDDLKAVFDPDLAAAGSFIEYSNIKTQGYVVNMRLMGMQHIYVTVTAKYTHATLQYKIAMSSSLLISDIHIQKLS